MSTIYILGVNYIHKWMLHSAAKVWREERLAVPSVPYNNCYKQFALLVLTLIRKLALPNMKTKRCRDARLLDQVHQAFKIVREVLTRETLYVNINLMRGQVRTHTPRTHTH